MNPTKPSIVKWLPLLLFAVAFLIRFVGIDWGLPNNDRRWSYHPDEPVNLMYARQISVGKGDLYPGFYNYGTLYLTAISIANDVVIGYSPPADENTIVGFYELDRKVIFGGRLISALAGAFTVAIVFLLLRRFFDPLPASLGALLIAVAPGHVVHSRFMTVDVFAVLFIALSAYAAMGILNEGIDSKGLWRATILSGVYAGLAAGTKYTGIVVLVVLLAILILTRPKNWIALAIGGVFTSIAAFLVSTPGAIRNSSKFINDFSYELNHSRTGHGLVFEGMPPSFLLHVINLAVGVGLILTIVSIFGLGWGVRNKKVEAISLGAFFVIYFLVLARAEVAFLRYTFPLLVPMAFGLAFLAQTASKIERGGKFVVAAVILFLGGIPFGEGLLATGRYTAPMAGTDSRDAVVTYLQSEAKEGKITVGVVADPWFYTPPMFPDANAPRYVELEYRIMAMSVQSKGIKTVQYIPLAPSQRVDWDVRLLTELKPQYVVASSYESYDLSRLAATSGHRPEIQVQVDRFVAFKKKLEELYSNAYFAGPLQPSVHDMDYARPMIWVWKLKAKP